MKYTRFFVISAIPFFLFAACKKSNMQISSSSSAAAPNFQQQLQVFEPKQLSVLRTAYPDITFSATYDEVVSDWLVSITIPATKKHAERTGSFYWQDGRLLPQEEINNKDQYWPLIYAYEKKIPDPKDFSQDDIDRIKTVTSPENRTTGAGTSPFFYDLVYDCTSRIAVESHIVKHSFLGKKTNIHERLCEPLDRVQKRIYDLARTESDVQSFIKHLSSADSYSWRAIGDSRKRSFHSMGIAIDILPRGWGKKNIYWAWRRDIDPENWMLLPLEKRWMPPSAVISAFEAEGFIWGGKWIIWDNMHFEYHPELLSAIHE